MVQLSVIIPVTRRYDPVDKLFEAYRKGIEPSGLDFEFIYVLDGGNPDVQASLQKLKQAGAPIKIVVLAKSFGDATALNMGFAQAKGDTILTLPAFAQVKAEALAEILAALEGKDMVVACRHPRRDSKFNVFSAQAFNGLLRRMLDISFRDLGCGVRVFKRKILDEISLYGDQALFLPVLAHLQGFKVMEVNASQASEDSARRVYSVKLYFQRLTDILTIFFLAKFTKKPLRFFGLIGVVIFLLGSLWTLWLAVERIFMGVALADRPALVLASLLIVLGIQMLAVGLIGELIIFTHAKDMKEYTVSEIVDES
jgi:glycosyltransferase involved in cell wall biosynthesis